MMRHLIKVVLITMMIAASNVMSAQTEHGFVPFAVEQEFNENGFSWFRHALILAAGDEQKSNAMTIGWGGIGTLWRKTAVTVYVAEQRYTKEFMDRAEYFTVMAFPRTATTCSNTWAPRAAGTATKQLPLGFTPHTRRTAHRTTPRPRWWSSAASCMPHRSTCSISRATRPGACMPTSRLASTPSTSARWSTPGRRSRNQSHSTQKKISHFQDFFRKRLIFPLPIPADTRSPE